MKKIRIYMNEKHTIKKQDAIAAIWSEPLEGLSTGPPACTEAAGMERLIFHLNINGDNAYLANLSMIFETLGYFTGKNIMESHVELRALLVSEIEAMWPDEFTYYTAGEAV